MLAYLKEETLLSLLAPNTNLVSKVVKFAVYSICVQPLLFSDQFWSFYHTALFSDNSRQIIWKIFS